MSTDWVGVPSSSEWWTLTADLATHFARDGIRTFALMEALESGDELTLNGAKPDSYLRGAVELLKALKIEEEEVAAEAIAIGMSWDVIGHALWIERTAAQKAYGHLRARGMPTKSCLDPEWSQSGQNGASRVARRQVGMLSHVVSISAPARIARRSQEWIGVLAWLSSARSLQRATESTIREIVEEMRCTGVTWRNIAGNLGVGPTAAQKRFRAGLSKTRLRELRHEKQAVDVLRELAATRFTELNFEDVTYSVTLNYSADRLQKACEYGAVLHGDVPLASIDEGLAHIEKSRTAINNVANSLATPGTFQCISLIARIFDYVNAPYLEIQPFVEYSYFMQLLSFAYLADSREAEETFRSGGPIEGIDELAKKYISSVVDALRIAQEALQVIEKLRIRSLYPLEVMALLLELNKRRIWGDKLNDAVLEEIARDLLSCQAPD